MTHAMKTALIITFVILLACASWYALSAYTIGNDDEDPPDWP